MALTSTRTNTYAMVIGEELASKNEVLNSTREQMMLVLKDEENVKIFEQNGLGFNETSDALMLPTMKYQWEEVVGQLIGREKVEFVNSLTQELIDELIKEETGEQSIEGGPEGLGPNSPR